MMHPREDNIFTPTEPNNVRRYAYRLTNSKLCVIHTKSRAKAKAVRARYAPFIRYVKNIKKLMGGNTHMKERPSVPLLHPVNSNLLSLALSKELEDNHKALVHLAYWESWNGQGDVLATFERIITRHHRDEMLEETVLPAGHLKTDKFKSLF
jgi:hypothetical protein